MSESDDRDITLILAFLEDRATDEEQAQVFQRLKADRGFAKQLAVQARLSAGLETLARVEAHAPEALAAALKAGAVVEPDIAGPTGRSSPGKSSVKPKRAIPWKGARAARRSLAPLVIAAMLLVALAAGWYFLTHQAPVAPPIVKNAPPATGASSNEEVAQIEFVPTGIAAADLPVLIHGQGATAAGQTVAAGMSVHAGDRLVTQGRPPVAGAVNGPKVQVGVKHRGGATIDLGEDTELVFPSGKGDPDFDISQPISLTRGRAFIQVLTKGATADGVSTTVKAPDLRMHFTTPNADFATYDAKYEIVSSEKESIARVQSGWLKVANALGLQELHQLEECVVLAAHAPAAPVAIFASAIWGGRGGSVAPVGPDAALAGLLTLERPTLVCLGATWVVKGDENHNATVYCRYREAGKADAPWRRSLNFWPIDSRGWPAGYRPVHEGETLFAGSLFELDEDTAYEVEFHLDDPDGQNATRTLTARTRATPVPFVGGRQLHVAPDAGSGGGTGTAQDPFRGLAAAEKSAQPGDTFLLHAGVYAGGWELKHSGEPGKPITWRGGVDGPVVLEGQVGGGKRLERIVTASDVHDLILDRLTLQNADYLVVAHGSQRITLMHCFFTGCATAITAEKAGHNQGIEDFIIADNVFRGSATWPEATKGREDTRAIYLGGQGHSICHNRLTGFGDAIDTAPSPETGALDIYLNDISEMTDDAIELDFSYRNARCFRNRITNVFQGISAQPVLGGPAYIFRNTLYNVELETIKLHSSPNGVLVFHNTGVKTGAAIELHTPDPVYHCQFRNNLWVGTSGEYALFFDSTMLRSDFDYDGFAGNFTKFLLWNRSVTATASAAAKTGGTEAHATLVEPAGCFVDGVLAPEGEAHAVPVGAQDLRLNSKSEAIDKGCVMPGVDDDYKGQAPDLGAFELGEALPVYGPRPEK
ncbi:MAG TPA: hypothetical protein VL860_15570 [Planctomycetota bacterium]|nr:hypothetical protein [Planctomycetota bacterium]